MGNARRLLVVCVLCSIAGCGPAQRSPTPKLLPDEGGPATRGPQADGSWLFPGEAINCVPGVSCIDSGPGCITPAPVAGQCSFPAAQAVALCAQHPLCVAVMCNSARTDCQARSTLVRTGGWDGFTSIYVGPMAGQAINCPNGVCISDGPGCITPAPVSGQCS